MQTAGTLTVMAGLILGVVAYVLHSADPGPSWDWLGDTAPFGAAILVVVGLVTSIVGRARKGGPV